MDNTIETGDLVKTPDGYFAIAIKLIENQWEVLLSNGLVTRHQPLELSTVSMKDNLESKANFIELVGPLILQRK